MKHDAAAAQVQLRIMITTAFAPQQDDYWRLLATLDQQVAEDGTTAELESIHTTSCTC